MWVSINLLSLGDSVRALGDVGGAGLEMLLSRCIIYYYADSASEKLLLQLVLRSIVSRGV